MVVPGWLGRCTTTLHCTHHVWTCRFKRHQSTFSFCPPDPPQPSPAHGIWGRCLLRAMEQSFWIVQIVTSAFRVR